MKFRRIQARGLGVLPELDVDIASKPGPLVAICGPNGRGKSTFLELLLGSVLRRLPTRGDLVGLAQARDASLVVDFDYGDRRYRARHLLDGTSRKSEAVLSNGDGRPLLDNSKVTAFDAYVEQHFPAGDVLLASVFKAQQHDAFIDARPAERKSLLMRIIGIQHIEAMAIGARAAVSETERAVAKLQGRLEQEGQRDIDQLRGAVVAATERKEACAAALGIAKNAREALERKNREADEANAGVERWRKARADLVRRAAEAEGKARELATRRRNNQTLTERRVEIEQAVAQLPAAETRVRELREQHGKAKADIQTALAVKQQRHERYSSLEAERLRIRPRADRRREITRSRERLAALELEAATAQAMLEGHRSRFEELQAKASDNRISDLRIGLASIRDSHSVIEAARETAAATLTRDDEAKAAETGVEDLRLEVARATRTARDKADLVAREKNIVAGEADVAAAEARLVEVTAEQSELAKLIDDSAAELKPLQDLAAGIDGDIRRAESAVEALRNTAKFNDQLQVATAKIDEYTRQIEELDAAKAAIDGELNTLGAEPVVAPKVPLAAATREEAEADVAWDEAIGLEATAKEHLRLALDSAERVAKLEAERAALFADLGDWQLLAKDLGKDGLQAALVDAALPELATLCNSLLHSNFGPRFTVDLRSQVANATGKKLLETLDIWVIDSERGREGPIETYSGGERTIVGEGLSLSLATLASRTTGLAGATLIRDEASAALDPVNGRAWIGMLRQAVTMMGADKLLFVSHSPDLQALADSRIEL